MDGKIPYDHESESYYEACGVNKQEVEKAVDTWTKLMNPDCKKPSQMIEGVERFIISEHGIREKSFILAIVYEAALQFKKVKQKEVDNDRKK